MGDAQAFGQQDIQFIPDAVAPMAHPGALMRQFVLEEFFAGEVLKVWALDPTVPDLLIG